MATTSQNDPRPCIAIVGRPNVGKSTLFNRLLGRRQAVVSSLRGTTRDRLYGRLTWQDRELTLIDTGGVEWAPEEPLGVSVQRQVERAMAEADGFLVVCDAQEGLVPSDEQLVQRLRTIGKPFLVAVNKAEDRLAVPAEFYSLGVEPIVPVSALHGRGISELLAAILQRLPDTEEPARPIFPAGDRPAAPAIAIVGRQNVGKSSLLNAFVRDERAIVSEIPGTTRDALDMRLTLGGRPLVLIDTAGLRHRRKVRSPIDTFSMSRAVEALRRCDVALLVLDAAQGVTSDDRRLVAQVAQIGCGLVLVVNKWDLVKGAKEARLTEAIRRALPGAVFAPAEAVSAKTGYHVMRSLETALQVAGRLQAGLGSWNCLPLLRRAWTRQIPPRIRGRVIQLVSARWVSGRPWQLQLVTKPFGALPPPYQNYLLKQLYADKHLVGIPISLRTVSPERVQ